MLSGATDTLCMQFTPRLQEEVPNLTWDRDQAQ